MRYPNNLKSLREERGWTLDRAANEMGMSRGGYIKIERGENRLTSTTIANAARAFGVTEVGVRALSAPTVPVVGYVGAGAEAHMFSDGQGPFDEAGAPAGATDATVAVEVRGTSLGQSFDGWYVYYDEVRNPPTSDLIGSLCVVGLADGRVLVKTLKVGQLPNRFTLISNAEQPVYDAEITWAARVRQMTPK